MRHYNRIARFYDAQYGNEQELKIEAVLKNLKFDRQKLVLDLGCGTGLLIAKIRDLTRHVVGLDVSKGMLKEAALNLSHLTCVHFVLADADWAPFGSGCFDAVFAITLLQNMPNQRRTVQEVKRIAQSEASIVVTGLKKNFSESVFLKLLEGEGLKAKLLKTDDRLKCHIAICEKCG